jgi:Ankyrin repeat
MAALSAGTFSGHEDSAATMAVKTARRRWAGKTTELHRAVFARDHERVRALLDCYCGEKGQSECSPPAATSTAAESSGGEDTESDGDLDVETECVAQVNRLDNNGNTALHIAAHWGDLKLVNMLLEAGAWCSWKSDEGWMPRQEATASGSFPVLRRLLDAELSQRAKEMAKRAERLAPLLRDSMPDFTGELKWAFKSWLPLVSSFLPHDRWRMWKRGSAIRVDTRITGFHGVHPTYGNVSLLFTGADHKRTWRDSLSLGQCGVVLLLLFSYARQLLHPVCVLALG